MGYPQKTVVSGIRATGPLHIGNYFGALKPFLELQKKPNLTRFLFIADYHTLTSQTDPQKVRRQVIQLGRELLSAGIDPQRTTLYLQSAVPEITELAYLLANVAFKGELERVATFKEKVRLQPENVNLALLSYPVLMAADVLGVEADLVPVGEDQFQHIELVRDFGKRFNHRYTPTFKVPRANRQDPVRIPGLDGTEKMGKTQGNTIELFGSEHSIAKAIQAAPTDSGSGPVSVAAQALLTILALLNPKVGERFAHERLKGNFRYLELKRALTKELLMLTTPMRLRYEHISERDVLGVLRAGSVRVAPLYQRTLDRARTHMGLLNPLRSRTG